MLRFPFRLLWFSLASLALPLSYAIPPATACTPTELAAVRSTKPGLRVLFVGNSYIYTNDLPKLISELSAAVKVPRPLLSCQSAPGGFTLEKHWAQGQVLPLLKQAKWDYVILQEQSQRPSFSAQQRQQEMNPYVREFSVAIQAAGAKPLLFMTWGYRLGDPGNTPGDTYWAMQQRIRQGYTEIGQAFSIPIVPVGNAWENALRANQSLDLWGPDGNHPSLKGSYLAASVFFAQLYGKSPVNNPYTAELSKSEAQELQKIAAKAALP